jgi:hypothetical protein
MVTFVERSPPVEVTAQTMSEEALVAVDAKVV